MKKIIIDQLSSSTWYGLYNNFIKLFPHSLYYYFYFKFALDTAISNSYVLGA